MKSRFSGRQAVWFVLSCGAGVVGATSQAVHAQTADGWKTVTSKEVGLSVRMPADAKAKTNVQQDQKTGATVSSLAAKAETPASIYLAVAVHLDKTALALLRQQSPGKDPLDLLYAQHIQPQVEGFLQLSPKGSKNRVTRKPIVWHGMKGEEVVGTVPSGPTSEGGQIQFRTARNADTVYLLFAGERTETAAGKQRTSRFFQSFTLIPIVPAALPTQPATPTQPVVPPVQPPPAAP